MTPKRPVLVSPLKPEKSPVAGKEEVPPKRWTFGFASFNQIKYFGLDNIGPKWFISFLDRLRDLSHETVDGFLSDGPKKASWRFHDIDWNSYNIPISRESLDWLPVNVKNNPAEFPLQQFQVSKALGRIVGYFDDEQVFQIVLLDPLHNLQPSAAFNYRVTYSIPLNCEYTQLREGVINAALQATCIEESTCPVKQALLGLDAKPSTIMNVVIMKPSDDAVKNANNLIAANQAASYEDIFETGVLQILEQLPSPVPSPSPGNSN